MESKVVIVKIKECKYPKNNFRADRKYPEYIFDEINS